MSYNPNAKEHKVHTIENRPPVLECGGKLDKDGIDSYWGESLTLQAEAENADITLIMQKYAKTGIITAPIKNNPVYGDYSTMPSFHEAQNIISKAHEQFDGLPLNLKKRFQNDPAQFLEFVHNDQNYDEALKLGLVKAKKQEQATTVATTQNKSPEGSNKAPV